MLGLPVLWGALLIFVIRVVSIAISTLRILVMGRANRLVVIVISFLEALTFVITFGEVVSNLSNIPNIISYCMGFAIGTIVGTWIEEKVGGGFATITIISVAHSHIIAEHLRKAGYGATRTDGEGTSGPVGLVLAVALRRQASEIMRIAQACDEKSFVAINETRSVTRGFLSYGRS